MIYYWDKKLKKKKKEKKRLRVLEADIITIETNINLMSLTQRMHFLLDVFQMTAIALVSVINYHINGLHLLLDPLYLIKFHMFIDIVSILRILCAKIIF